MKEKIKKIIAKFLDRFKKVKPLPGVKFYQLNLWERHRELWISLIIIVGFFTSITLIFWLDKIWFFGENTAMKIFIFLGGVFTGIMVKLFIDLWEEQDREIKEIGRKSKAELNKEIDERMKRL